MSGKLAARHAILILAMLALGLWGVFVWQVSQGPVHSAVIALGHALMLTAMLIAYPFLVGWRVSHGKLHHVLLCPECHAPRWDTEAALGFCLRCGSVKAAKAAVY